MPNYIVIYSKGQAHLRGGSIDFEVQPGRHQLEIAAADKPSACVSATEHFERLGLNAWFTRPPETENPLGLTDQQIRDLEDRGITLRIIPTTGVRIDNIMRAL
ncbi:MAG TPA: hypothetical protein VL501_00990 [Pyrinomonadaceae bacterium]|nr:hypothetical protein [Pyrinomonadaceae bacterium]